MHPAFEPFSKRCSGSLDVLRAVSKVLLILLATFRDVLRSVLRFRRAVKIPSTDQQQAVPHSTTALLSSKNRYVVHMYAYTHVYREVIGRHSKCCAGAVGGAS